MSNVFTFSAAAVVPAAAVVVVGVLLFLRRGAYFPPTYMLGIVAYTMLSQTASVAYLESSSSYITEMALTSHARGATTRLAFYNVFIFAIAYGVLRLVVSPTRPAIALARQRLLSRSYDKELRWTLITAATLLAIQLANALASPPYALPTSGVDRQYFWDHVRSPVLGELIGILVIFVPAVVGVALAYGRVVNSRHFRRAALRLLGLYVVFGVVTGMRFHGGLTVLMQFVAAYCSLLWLAGQKVRLRRSLPIVFAAIFAFLLVGQLELADRQISQQTGGPVDGFLYRTLVLQGGVYYAADARRGEGETHSAALLTETMPTTIRFYTPPSLGQSYIDRGVNLAGSLPGNSVVVLGYLAALVPLALYAAGLGVLCGLVIFCMAYGRFMLILPGSYICQWGFGCYVQGSFSIFLGYRFPLFVFLCLLWIVARHTRKPSRRMPATKAAPLERPSRRVIPQPRST